VGFAAPDGWDQESETLYLHRSGVRIERMIYRKKEGWVLVPVDLDRPVIEFPPSSEGLEHAFAAFSKGILDPAVTGTTKEVQEARKAARRDENPTDSDTDAAEDAQDKDDEEEA
jgi:hypothetical protein